MRPVHTGVHLWAPSRHSPGAYCTVCDFLEFACAGHRCSGIRGQLGRPVSEGIANAAFVPPAGSATAFLPDDDVNPSCEEPKRPVKNRRGISPATPDQRLKAKGSACVACGLTSLEATIDPAHLLPRGLTSIQQDDERAVVPLCRRCHNAYDREQLDLSPHLEPGYRAEVAFAVERVGLFAALRRITNTTWTPERAA